MHATAAVRNPFVMLTDPEALLRAIDESAPLKSLHGRICRPLDRVSTPKVDDSASAAVDTEGDAELDLPEGDAA
jgi:hypothetical protein